MSNTDPTKNPGCTHVLPKAGSSCSTSGTLGLSRYRIAADEQTAHTGVHENYIVVFNWEICSVEIMNW